VWNLKRTYQLQIGLALIGVVVGIAYCLITVKGGRGASKPLQATAVQKTVNSMALMFGHPERMSSAMAKHIGSAIDIPTSNLLLQDSQRISAADEVIWLVTGGDAGGPIACMARAPLGAVVCGRATDFERQGLVLGTAKSSQADKDVPQDFKLLGVAPDWVKAVEVLVGSTTTRQLPVRNHVYIAQADVPIFVKRLCGPPHHPCQEP
jgi:hypothetical protein